MAPAGGKQAGGWRPHEPYAGEKDGHSAGGSRAQASAKQGAQQLQVLRHHRQDTFAGASWVPTLSARSQLAPRQVQHLKRYKERIPIPTGSSIKRAVLAYGWWGICINTCA